MMRTETASCSSEAVSESVLPYTAIAFDWYPVELGRPDSLRLVVEVVRLHSKDETSEQEIKCTVNFDQLAAMPLPRGSSEAVGLIPQSSFYYDNEKAACFERTLADLIMESIDTAFKDGETRIVLEGPMFEKLVGRLGYRFIDRQRLLAALTFKNEWLPNVRHDVLLWNQVIMGDTEVKGGLFKPPHEKRSYGCADIKPPNGITETVKTWALVEKNGEKSRKKMLYALDILCQFPYDATNKEEEHPATNGRSAWISKIGEIKRAFAFPGLVFAHGEALWLPFALACAHDKAVNFGKSTRVSGDYILSIGGRSEYSAFYERDVPRMYLAQWPATEVVGRRGKLYLAAHEDKLYNEIVDNSMRILGKARGRELVSADPRATLKSLLGAIFSGPDGDLSKWKTVVPI